MAETRDTRPKKQIPLRLSAKLYDQIAAWAEDDFRSVNGQIEYLLTECVRQRKKNGKYVSDTMDKTAGTGYLMISSIKSPSTCQTHYRQL